MAELRRTSLYELQVKAGARFVAFAGWEMPVQYTSVVEEHLAVRKAAGLFDVSHMGEFLVEGRDAARGLRFAVTNDVLKLKEGRAQYTLMCREDGGIVDDLIIYRERDDRFFVVVNASRIADDYAHLQKVLEPFDCTLTDISDQIALLALQGPKSLAILGEVTSAPAAELRPFSFVDAEVAGIADVRIARTGYTGEDGVELYLPQEAAPALWGELMERGASYGILPIGLGARDTLRLEMKFPLYGQDIDLDHNPLEAGLQRFVKLDGDDFVGREALRRVQAEGPRRALVGFTMRGRGIPRHGYSLWVGDRQVGSVTSGTHSPSLQEPIGMGYVAAEHQAVGTEIEVEIRDRRVPAIVAATPFYRR